VAGQVIFVDGEKSHFIENWEGRSRGNSREWKERRSELGEGIWGELQYKKTVSKDSLENALRVGAKRLGSQSRHQGKRRKILGKAPGNFFNSRAKSQQPPGRRMKDAPKKKSDFGGRKGHEKIKPRKQGESLQHTKADWHNPERANSVEKEISEETA